MRLTPAISVPLAQTQALWSQPVPRAHDLGSGSRDHKATVPANQCSNHMQRSFYFARWDVEALGIPAHQVADVQKPEVLVRRRGVRPGRKRRPAVVFVAGFGFLGASGVYFLVPETLRREERSTGPEPTANAGATTRPGISPASGALGDSQDSND